MSGKAQITEPGTNMKMLVVMVSIGLICAFLIVLTFEQTRPIIIRKQEEALNKAIFKVLPGINSTIPLLINNGQILPYTSDQHGVRIHAGFDQKGDLTGFAVEASGQGYADIIKLIYGYDHISQKVIGIQILETKETPGLGDRIEKDPSFLQNFKALDVRIDTLSGNVIHSVQTVKQGKKTLEWEVEGITGATISSRAVGDIIRESSETLLPVIQANFKKIKSAN